MSRTSSHETITLSRRPASPGMCVPFAGVSTHTEPIPPGGRGRRIPACGAASDFFMPVLSIHTPSVIHCGVSFHSNNFGFLLVELFPMSGRSVTSRPAAGLRPLHPLISIPDAAHAATDRIVVRHKMKFSRTPERCLCTVPEAGFAPAATPAPLIRMDGVPIKSGKILLRYPHRSILFSPSNFHFL